VERRDLVTAELGDGVIIHVEARRAGDSEEDVGIGKALAFDGVIDSIEANSRSMTAALAKAKPDKATVEFGLDIAVEAGQLTSLLVKGSGTATLTVTLEWETAPAA